MSNSPSNFIVQLGKDSRVINFATIGCIDYFSGGSEDCTSIIGGFGTFLSIDAPIHTGNLPDQITDVSRDAGDLAMTELPFFNSGVNHWGIAAGGTAWEMDDAPGDDLNDTLHRIFVR